MNNLKRATLAILLIGLVGVFAFWQWLDVTEVILGDAHVAVIDPDHVFVSWNDFGEEIPDQAHVITRSGLIAGSELAGRDEVVSVEAADGRVAYATVSEDLGGSIWLADPPQFQAHRIVGPDDRVNHGTELVFVGHDRLVWSGFAGGSKSSISLTNLASSETREFFRLDQVLGFRALRDGGKVVIVARPPGPTVDQPRVLVLNLESGLVEETFGHDEVVSASVVGNSTIFLVAKRGRIKTLTQCPGDSGPGDNRNLRPGRLLVVREGQVEDLIISFNGEPSEVVSVPGREALIVTVTKEDREGCPESNYYYLDVGTLQPKRLEIPPYAFFEPSLDGSLLGFVDNGSLRVTPLLPGGTAQAINPEGSGALSDISWSPSGALWFVSNMNPSGSGTGPPGVWQRSVNGELNRVFTFLGSPPARNAQAEIIAILLGLGFLFVFYRAIQLKWPESYFGATDLSAYSIASSPIRYLAFRFMPVYITCLFAAVTLDRGAASSFTGALGIGIGHSLLTSGWALIQASRWEKSVRRHRFPILMLRILVLFTLVPVAWFAWRTRSIFAGLVPELPVISATLWTGLVAAVVGAFIVRVTRGHSITEHEMVEEELRRIPAHLFQLAGQEATVHDADPNLAQAVMIVENLQRPPWFRRLENVKGTIFKRGTYGIMQVESTRPLSDEESIQRSVRERLVGVSVLDEKGYVDEKKLKAFATNYNPNPNFFALLGPAYRAAKNKAESR